MTSQDPIPALGRILQATVRFLAALVAAPAALADNLADDVYRRLDRAVLRLGNRIIDLIRGKSPRRPAATPRPAAPKPPSRLPASRAPRRPGWLRDAMPETAQAIAQEIRAALQDPALAALLAQDPVTARILKPLCRMLGLDLPALPPCAPAAPTARPSPKPTQRAPQRAQTPPAPVPSPPPPSISAVAR